MGLKGMLAMILAAGVSPAFGRNAAFAPLPNDPLELVMANAKAANSPASRRQAIRLLARARSNYALRSAGRAYDLKTSFNVDSGGQTGYDGGWQMEDMFDPGLGLRWTARSPTYTVTRIFANGKLYGDQTGSYVPLRVQEARAALFDPIPAPKGLDRASLRTASVVFEGARLTCVLLSGPAKASKAPPGRRWNETEECIDPQSGLLRVHSQVPGRYYAYDYSNGPRFYGHLFPRTVLVTEAGRIVTRISVDSLTELPAADPGAFTPTAEMKAAGQAIALAGATKILVSGQSSSTPAAHAVCVFGVVTPSGQLVEAHSLQPSDPDSQKAVEDARHMGFFQPPQPGARPQQHFVFVIERFLPAR